jgi:nitroimidazol reductase NimA-like FMN-containing flavoprotein (pyridoxamine 5'-phosphate oxidase superfamily)
MSGSMSTWTRIQHLDEAESLRMLGSVRWGRCAWNGPEGPRILPVNLTVLDRSVFFRTNLYGSLVEAADGRAVALEADELDDRLSSGWSVVVLGHAKQVEDPAEVASVFSRLGDPWAPGSRPVVVKVDPSQVTGRRFLRA